MFLKSLKIENGSEIVREILFHKGINLIVDETVAKNKTESGNSVGKTTVIRLIDFCFDGDGKNIYIDPEFKAVNYKIESFLKENNIIITLILIENIDDPQSDTITIRRNFIFKNSKIRKDKIQEINGKQYSSKEFGGKLKELIFKSKQDKPKIRQLVSKNIRDEKNKLLYTLKVLSPFNTDADYESLFLFWLGIPIDTGKDKLVKEKNLEEKLQARLKKESTLSQINQSLVVINKEIVELALKKDSFSLNENFEKELQLLNETKQQINNLSTKIGRLEIRRDLINESRLDLEKDFANIDTQRIQKLYEKASSLIPNLQKTFEETLTFHNEMIKQKISFITEELPQLEREINESKRNLTAMLNLERTLSSKLTKTGAIEDLQLIIEELNDFHEKKGKFEELRRLWQSSNENLDKINAKLDDINKSISSKDELIQERIMKFNEYFSDLSSRLDGVHSVLSADNTDGVYKFSIGNIEGNPGTGSKKSQMASFDLAYIKFADANNIPCMHFILQDQIENVHSNQITNLLTEIVEEVNCQYILPVLKDKLPSDIDIKQYEILSLSQSKKLFNVI